MKILHILGDCNPAKGGVIEGVLRLGGGYRKLGHTQHLLTMDDNADPWVADFPSRVFARGRKGNAKRFWPGQAIAWLRANASSYDGIVVDGLWNASTLAAARTLPGMSVPYVVFPHGMLDPWFRELQPMKEWIKRQQFRFVERPLLRGARATLFTSEQERVLASRSWPGWTRIDEKVVGYGTGEPPPEAPAMAEAFKAAVPKLGASPYLLFLSRIHPKKGCEILLEGFARQYAGTDMRLVIAGLASPAYLDELIQLAQQLGIAGQVEWPGHLGGDAKWGALYGCEAMVLTSYQENFGVVVAEALACMRPVLISDQVNIHDAVTAANAGIVCETDPASIHAALSRFSGMDEKARDEMGKRGRELFEARFSMDRVAMRVASIFQDQDG
ncbi:glycosyltransferase [Qipengyuania sp. CAU 1752]